jgi:hypothetical protein
MPIAIHFEEVAVSSFSAGDIARLKIVFQDIYESLGTIEPEIEATKGSTKSNAKSKRKMTPSRSQPKPRTKDA